MKTASVNLPWVEGNETMEGSNRSVTEQGGKADEIRRELSVPSDEGSSNPEVEGRTDVNSTYHK